MRWLIAVALLSAPALAQTVVLEGDVPDGSDFFLVGFDVPAGTREVEVRHPVQQPLNILDYGVRDPERFRGWGGGNTEPLVVGEAASSRSYLTGPLPAGRWSVVIGRAKVVSSPARYRLEIDLRAAPTLAPQPERRAYAHVPALKPGRRWYAGDFHVHSKESGDARPPLDEIATFARGRGLDFVELSDHNTVSQLDFMLDAQARHPELLFVPGVEFTTYAGHANGIGATQYVDSRIGFEGRTFEQAAAQFAAQGAVLSINHPALDLGTACIGCAWKQKTPRDVLGAVEIGTGGWDVTGVLFTRQAIAFWESLNALGLHVAPVGGSDDHQAGQDMGAMASPIGNPTTLVLADELSVPAIVDAVKHGRTVVKLQGPDDPMVDLESGDARIGDTLEAKTAELKATVTGGQGQVLKLLENGEVTREEAVTADPFTVTQTVTAPADGSESRWRAEVWVDGNPRTVTGHLWVRLPPAASGCGCTGAGDLLGLLPGVVLLALRRRHPRG